MRGGQVDKLFEIQRKRLLKKYEDAKQPFEATTKPYKSTAQVVWTVVDPLPQANPTMAFLIARPQTLSFFNYGVGDQIPWADGQKRATRSDTSLKKGGTTQGVEDFVIEGMSATSRGVRIAYARSTDPNPTIPPDVKTPEVRAMYLGLATVLDPGSLVVPPQVQSPANLEDVLTEALKPNMSIKFSWDTSKFGYIGTLDDLPEGGAKSYLRASGEPRVGNWYRIPEGYLWRREGEPDSSFLMEVALEEPVVVPISLVPFPGTTLARIPLAIYLDFSVRLHGLAVKVPGQN